MELNESAAEGAARETWEEAQAHVHNLRLFSWMDIPVIGQATTPLTQSAADVQCGRGGEGEALHKMVMSMC